MAIYKDYLKLIGKTPIVKINYLPYKNCSNVYLKLECFNAGGSIKDRAALKMIEDFETNGLLKPGMTIVESSSGNTAIGLAIICAIKGYKLIVICDHNLPNAKKDKLRAYGVDIVFVPFPSDGSDTVDIRIRLAKEISNSLPNAISTMQYENSSNPEAHYLYTGQEIWEDFEDNLNACVIAVGTCGSISGIGRALKEKNKEIMIYGVESYGSVIFGGEYSRYHIQGGGLSFIPPILDRSVIDKGFKVTDEDAIKTAKILAEKEGILVGGTGALVVYTCYNLAREMGLGKNIVGVIPDSGDRYLDTIYSNSWQLSHNFNLSISKPIDDYDMILEKIILREGCTINEY